jgi:hypothetical protein
MNALALTACVGYDIQLGDHWARSDMVLLRALCISKYSKDQT